jgi:hypothetical protein
MIASFIRKLVGAKNVAAASMTRKLPGFDRQYYLDANPDVKEAGVDPLQHFEEFGWREGRDPSPHFSVKGYLSANPDVEAAGVNPLAHFVEHGLAEGRAGWTVSAAPRAHVYNDIAIYRAAPIRSSDWTDPARHAQRAYPEHPWSLLPPTPKAVAEAMYWLLDAEADPEQLEQLLNLSNRAEVRHHILCQPEFQRVIHEMISNGSGSAERLVRLWKSTIQKKLPIFIDVGQTIDVASGLEKLRVAGWGSVEEWGFWSIEPRATVAVRIVPTARDPVRLSVDYQLFAPNGLRQSVGLRLDHLPVQTLFESGSASFVIEPLVDGRDHLLIFDIEQPIAPADIDQSSSDRRKLGIGLKALRLS